ncbi:MAG: GTP-binding protein, partial [Spirochaetales bacterium]
MKSGLVAIVGRPSSGKSTLLNIICGYKVSIVSVVPQTTRNRIRGILTEERGQLVFLDTPGYHKSEKKMNLRMTGLVEASLAEAGWQGAYNVAAGPRGFVSIGTAGEIGYCDPEEKCSIDGAVWRSSDGTHWQRVPHDDDVFGPPDGGQVFMIDVVAAGELGFVATGIAPERVSGLPRPVVWTSRDGESWSREPVPPGPPLKSPVNRRDWFVVPRAVAGGANDGPVVAVGNEGHFPSPPQYSVAAAWVSADGQSWARVPHDEDAFGDGTGAPLSLADVTAGGPGFVAVGEVGAEEAAVDVLRTPGPRNLRAYILTSAD